MILSYIYHLVQYDTAWNANTSAPSITSLIINDVIFPEQDTIKLLIIRSVHELTADKNPRMASLVVISQPVSMDGENIIAEAILGYPSFRDRACCKLSGCFSCFNCCTCCQCCDCTTRLYLINSSIVYSEGLPSPRTYADFRIDLKNIVYIKSINDIITKRDCQRTEVRGYSKLIIQVKDDSPQMMSLRWWFLCCLKWISIQSNSSARMETNLWKQSSSKWLL